MGLCVTEGRRNVSDKPFFRLSRLVKVLRILVQLEHLCLDGMRGFLHFDCASVFCVYFRRSKGGACLLFEEFEAENSQCVDVFLARC